MSDKIKEYLSVFFKHMYDFLQHPERLIFDSLIVYIIGCILLMFALSISIFPEWVEIFETIMSYATLILIIIWSLLLLVFILIHPSSDNSSIEDESWIYDLSANKLMLLEIREHCNNCALRKYKEEK